MMDLDEIKALVERATPGPWAVESCGEKGDGSNMIGVVFDPAKDPECKQALSGWLREWDDDGNEIEYYRDELIAECEHRNRNSGADAAFIAAARSAVPDLVAEVERLRAELAAVDARIPALEGALKKLGVAIDATGRVLTDANYRSAP